MKKFSILLLCLLLPGSVTPPIILESALSKTVSIFAPSRPLRHIPNIAVSSDVELASEDGITSLIIPSVPVIERALIISYDGMRPDAIAAAPMNNLLGLINGGAYTMTNAVTIAYPSTLPSHAAMLSGLCMKQNGIIYDKYYKYMGYSKGVDIFDLAHGSGMRTVMIVGKDKLRQLAEPETTDVFEVRYDEASIAQAAVGQISQGFGLMFVHFPSPDQVGHKYGWMGISYLKMLRNGDDALGNILAELDRMGLRETTLVIVTADHGGHDKNHIGLVIEDFQIPWIAAGTGIVPAEINASIQTMDTAATVAYALGWPLQPDWVGIPVYEAFGESRLNVHPEDINWPCHQWN